MSTCQRRLVGVEEELRRRLTISEQEREQLQASFEDTEQRLQLFADEIGTLQARQTGLAAENGRLRHLLAQSQARLLEAQVAARPDTMDRPVDLEGQLNVLNEELRVSLEELQVTAEELETANTMLREFNETLERQIAERTASLAAALAQRDAALGRKDLLIREVDHRVKNSLQMVMSLLRIQSAKVGDPKTRRALQTAMVRIQAIAQVHTMLYARSDVEAVAFDRYLDEICSFLGATLGANVRGRKLLVEAETVELLPDLAIPLALITTELVTNAFRHAFDGTAGTVWVRFHRRDGGLELVVADDGRGLAPDFDPSQADGLGLQVVMAMVNQVGGKLDISRNDGACFALTLPAAGEGM
ncbi:histidine kinase [Skermanella stibiiresistens SB22]|uniref:histidine kinase n=1 Tax=Skermanella stibiiresistens SB22 TaxID=1385369 RepID=W9H436_9PROT|nr:sensor histidine kinase [Skermanella stibiiresistens]EWY40970.1 histidine kinase [Skermanella stibiiresistens SB22]